MPPFVAESGKTAMQPTVSHLVPHPEDFSCCAPVPPSGWKSNITGSGPVSLPLGGRWTMNVRDAPLDMMVSVVSPDLSEFEQLDPPPLPADPVDPAEADPPVPTDPPE